MYRCNKCNKEFPCYVYQHGLFSIEQGKLIINSCTGLVVFYPEIETNNDEKDSICRR